MLIKKKWIELIEVINSRGRVFSDMEGFQQDGMANLLDEIDSLFNTQIGYTPTNVVSLKDTYITIVGQFLVSKPARVNLWKDMPIYMSSYDFNDFSKINEVYLRLLQYAGFYKKILTDKGLMRKVVTHRDYRNAGHNESTNKNIYSETPQASIASFDTIINYVSNANKVDDESDSTTYGDSDLTVDSASWDEAEKNMKLIYYNDLISYINRIPHLIYSLYSLDTTPYTELQREYYEYIKVLYER